MGNPNNVNLKREVGNTALIIFLTPLKQQNLNFVNHNQPSNANCLKGDTGYRWRGWKRFFPNKQSTVEKYIPQTKCAWKNPSSKSCYSQKGESSVHHGQGSSWRDPILLCSAGLVLQLQSEKKLQFLKPNCFPGSDWLPCVFAWYRLQPARVPRIQNCTNAQPGWCLPWQSKVRYRIQC